MMCWGGCTTHPHHPHTVIRNEHRNQITAVPETISFDYWNTAPPLWMDRLVKCIMNIKFSLVQCRVKEKKTQMLCSNYIHLQYFSIYPFCIFFMLRARERIRICSDVQCGAPAKPYWPRDICQPMQMRRATMRADEIIPSAPRTHTHTYARHVCAVDHTRTRTNGGETATAGGADLFTNSEDPISILPPLCAFSKSCAYVHATAPQRTAPHRIVRTCVHACIQASGNVCGPFI